ncbi:RNA-binding protein [Candidatus Micrarchaeota archaeon]|nr:RNA-binding protein [Candidatus Micrarchaeota archaeon]
MSKKLYVGNLPYSLTKEDLVNLFSSYGEISDAVLITDRMTGRSKGFGFVTFENDEDADKAIAEMDGKEVEGMNIKVNVARPMEERKPRRGGGFGGGRGFGGGGRRRF